jgi:hypothetical protein
MSLPVLTAFVAVQADKAKAITSVISIFFIVSPSLEIIKITQQSCRPV